MKLSPTKKVRFQELVWSFYAKNKRTSLPWRKKITPYKIWISEVMLQQTQVDRVVPFFEKWMKNFPTIKSLANAPQNDILRHWKGLGYNSRALRLKKAAQKIVEDHGGKFPKKFEDILELPGIGLYTAGAVSVFAFGEKNIFIETNIRRFYLHEFFKDQRNIHDKEILELVEATLPKSGVRDWYWALMDYGSYLGRSSKNNPNRKSRHYTKQSKFIGSDRQIRGRILEILLGKKKVTIEVLHKTLKDLSKDIDRIERVLNGLEKEGFVEIKGGKIFIKK